jgi:hypothetical protein
MQFKIGMVSQAEGAKGLRINRPVYDLALQWVNNIQKALTRLTVFTRGQWNVGVFKPKGA